MQLAAQLLRSSMTSAANVVAYSANYQYIPDFGSSIIVTYVKQRVYWGTQFIRPASAAW